MDSQAQGTILADALLIDRIIRRFEHAYRGGENPQVEAFLESIPATHRSIAHERLKAAAERLAVEDQKRNAEADSMDATCLHVSENHDTEKTPAGQPTDKAPVKLGAFEIEKELGRGAFGIVYKARDTLLDRQVAIKVPLLDSEKLRQQYIDEARKAAMIECVGIVPIYHVDVNEKGSPYVVQKFIDGPNLRELLQRVGGVELLSALMIVRDVARALAMAHREGMIHRDLKPENILLDSEGKPWIADFGLALREDEQDGRAGEVAGTPLYMSPEQVRGKADWLDGRTDIWAAGVLMYELIAGRPPFAAKSVDKLVKEICRRDPKPLTQRSADLPPVLDEIFDRCCAKKARDRFASADELANQIDALLKAYESGDGSIPTATDLPSRLASSGSASQRSLLSSWTSVGGSALDSRGRSLDTSQDFLRSTVRIQRKPMTKWVLGTALLAVTASALSLVYFGTRPLPSEPGPATGRKAIDVRPSVPGPADSRATTPTIADVGPSSLDSVDPDAMTPLTADTDSGLADASADPSMDQVQVDPVVAPPEIDLRYLTVSQEGKGTHRTIAAALSDVESGGDIKIEPGFYTESLTFDKPVTLIGAEDRAHVVIQSPAGPAVLIEGGTVILDSITLRGFGIAGQHEFNTIDLVDGAVKLIGCDVTASTFCCVKVRKGTNITAIDTQFSSLADSAVSCVDANEVALQECTFRDCRGAAIELIGCTGKVTKCSLLGNNQYGVYCENTGRIPVEIRDCKWEGCGQAGISAVEGGLVEANGGTLSRCKVSVEARGGKVDLRDVTLRDGTGPGLSVTQSGQLTATECILRTCMVGLALQDSKATLTKCQINDMRYVGMYTKAGSTLVLEECTISGSGENGITSVDTALTMTGGFVRKNGAGGLYVSGNDGILKMKNVLVEANSKIGLHVLDGRATVEGGSVSEHEIGVLVERSPASSLATLFDAEGLELRENAEIAFQFLAGTEGDLKGCRTSGHQENRALIVSVEADVLTDKACRFEE